MLRKIINTFTSNVFIALLNLLIAVVISQYLGAAGKGVQSIFITNIALLLVVCNIAGGASLVYLVPRYDNLKIIWPAYLWTLLICFVLYFILDSFKSIEGKYLFHICLLTSISSFTAINSTILLGHEQIRKRNFIAVVQTFLVVSTLLFLFSAAGKRNFDSYLIALYVGYFISFFISFTFIFPLIRSRVLHEGSYKYIIKEMFRYGFLNQLGHIFQLLSFRLSYYVLLLFLGQEEVGIYSNGVSLVESVWLISRSIAAVQYARIANSTDTVYSQLLTVRLLKSAMLMSLIILAIMSVLPPVFFTSLFGEEFGRVNQVILLLAPGILFHNISLLLGHYFSGRAQYHINTFAAFLGLIITGSLCYLLIPSWGIYGAAIATDISLISMSMLVLFIFKRASGLPFRVFLPGRDDLREYIRLFRSF